MGELLAFPDGDPVMFRCAGCWRVEVDHDENGQCVNPSGSVTSWTPILMAVVDSDG